MRGTVAAVSVITAGITVIAPSGVAHATDPITQNAVGTYTMGWKEDQPAAKWVLTPCADDAPRCVTVSQYALNDTAMKKPVISGTAFWTVGSWFTTIDVPNLVKCPDGTTTTLPATFSWDAATGVGNRAYSDPGLCGKEAKINSRAIFLNKVDSATPAAPPAPAPAPAPAAAPSAAPSAAPAAAPPAPPPPAAAESPAG